MNIAILGSTSHIAKNITYYLSKDSRYTLFLFTRTLAESTSFLSKNLIDQSRIHIKLYSDFFDNKYDSIINCVGITNGKTLTTEPNAIFVVTEKFDNLCVEYLKNHSECLYINFSSGAIYGGAFDQPASLDMKAELEVNNLTSSDYYGVTKLYVEAKHRSLRHLNIVDLRVFNFFSRFVDPSTTNFFLSDVINCIQQGKPLMTDQYDMIRDYVHPLDLMQSIEKCIELKQINSAYDLYSKQPVSKMEIIGHFEQYYNMQYEITDSLQSSLIAGKKKNYYSINNSLNDIGYVPKYSSKDSITDEFRFFI